jgi:hypothetical protein
MFVWLAVPALARPPGEVIAEFSDVSGTFSGGDPEFTVLYDVVVIDGTDGTIYAVFEQQGSPDSPFGPVNSKGVPLVLRNPGKEKFTGGRIKNARTLTYDRYEYVSGGQTSTWTSVVFTFPAGSLPFPAAQEEAEPTPTPAEEEEEEDSPETAVTQPSSEDEGGFPTGVIVAVAAGAAVVAGATRLVTQTRTKGKRTCDEEHAAWQSAEAAYDQAVAAEADARDALHDRGIEHNQATNARGAAYTEAFRESSANADLIPEAQAEWDKLAPEYDARIEHAQANLDAAQAALDVATVRRKELDAKRQEAKAAYEECVGQAQAAAATADTGTLTTGPATVATAPPPTYGPTQERGCKPGTTRNRRSTRLGPIHVVIDSRMWAEPTGTRMGRYSDATEVAVSLKEIAEMLGDLEEGKLPGKAGELQDLKDQAKDLADKAGTLAEEGIGEFVKGEISDAIQEQVDAVNEAAADALNDATGVGDAIDAIKKVPDLLKEPHKIPLEILKFTAELGAEVALFAGRVVEANDMYRVYAQVQTVQVDVLWTTWEVCVNNRWKKAFEVVTANGPTKWSDPPKDLGEFPGSAYGQYLDLGMKRALQWCQTQVNNSNEKLSQSINNPPTR